MVDLALDFDGGLVLAMMVVSEYEMMNKNKWRLKQSNLE